MSRCIVEPGLEFESSLFARELLEELRLSVPTRHPRPRPAAPERPARASLPRATVVMIPIIIDEEFERWDGMG